MLSLEFTQDFYIAGGTLQHDAPCYVARQADQDLYESLRQGHYCYVLTARQMGKSSLMVRTAARLCDNESGLTVAVLDPTGIGQNVTLEQWYGGLLFQLGRPLALEDELHAHWQIYAELAPLQRWLSALREVVLRRAPGRVVIFIDEIDAVRSLPFATDEFFAGIRECYNRRATDAALERLSCCLLGVATPSDLIRDTRTTPFNIGRRIELHDFTAEEAAPLAAGLQRDAAQSTQLLARILHWTGGHPYLTQRLCQAIADKPDIQHQDGVDHLCRELFCTQQARERDDNLLFVRDRMLRGAHDVAGLLSLYGEVRRKRAVVDDPTNAHVSALHLAGVVRTHDERLQVRNRIYETVFDQAWVKRNLPDAELRRQRAAYRRGVWRTALVSGVMLLLVSALAWSAIRQREAARRLLEAAQLNRYAQAVEQSSTAQIERLVSGLAYNNRIKQAQDEWEAANITRVEELLNECRPQPGAEDLRGFEWHHLWRLSHQAQQSFKLDNDVVGLAFSSDGARLAIGENTAAGETGKRYEVSWLDWRNGQTRPAFTAPTGAMFPNVLFSASQRYALVEDAASAGQLLELASGRVVGQFGGHQNRLAKFALAPDERRVVTTDLGGLLKFWERAPAGSTVREIAQHQLSARPRWVAFSGDGRRVVSVDGTPRLTLWDAATGQRLSEIRTVSSVPTAAVFFPGEQRLLCAARDGSLQVYETGSGKFVMQWPGHSGQIDAMAFAPDGGRLATGSEDHTVRLWEAATGRALALLKGHGEAVSRLAWSPDGAYLATGGGERVNLWEVAPLLQPAFSGAQISLYLATAFAADGHLLALGVTGEQRAELWDVTARRVLFTLDEPGGNLYFAVFSRDGSRVAAGGLGNRVTVWDVAAGRRLQTLIAAPATKNVLGAAFSPDGQQLVMADDNLTLKVWELASGRAVQTINSAGLKPACQSGFSYRLVFAPDGRLAAACRDGNVALFAAAGDFKIFAQTGQVYSIAFTPAGDGLALGGKGAPLNLWDARTGRALQRLGQADTIQHIVFAPDGQRLVTGSSDGTVKIWDVTTGQELLVLHKHADTVTGLAFARDGRQLASCAADGTVRWQQAATP